MRGCETPPAPPGGGTGSEGPGRPGLVNWRIERVTRRAIHPARRKPPASCLLQRAAVSSPGGPPPPPTGRRVHPSGSPGASPLPARGPRPARAAKPPTAGGPLRRAAGACRWRGRGRQRARLPSPGLPLGPRRSRLVCAARPHTVRHAPPAPAVDPSAADRWPGWSASLHTLRPLLGRAEVCSPSLAQKVLGGAPVVPYKVGHPVCPGVAATRTLLRRSRLQSNRCIQRNRESEEGRNYGRAINYLVEGAHANRPHPGSPISCQLAKTEGNLYIQASHPGDTRPRGR